MDENLDDCIDENSYIDDWMVSTALMTMILIDDINDNV